MSADVTRRARLVAAFAVAGLIGAACGANPGAESTDGPDTTTADGALAEIAGVPVGRPGPVTASAPLPSAAPPVPDEVDLREPDLLVTPASDDESQNVYEAFDVDGVEFMASTRRFEGTLTVEGIQHQLDVLAVDPNTFRPMTPEVTAQAPDVWRRLIAGDGLLRHDVAHNTGAQLGESYLLSSKDGGRELRIGALASNGAPPLADLVVPWELGTELAQGEANLLLIAVSDDVSNSTAMEGLREVLVGAKVTERERPVEQQAALRSSDGRVTIEPFRYTDLGDGMIVIDPAWVRRYIVTLDLPLLGPTRTNRVMVPQLVAALEEVRAAGLAGHFDPSQYAGSWVPRHIDWNPRRSLSMHAWGLAIDINSRDNCLGCRPKMDPRIVEIFERWGFNWGGYWSRPDGMHFELARIVDVP